MIEVSGRLGREDWAGGFSKKAYQILFFAAFWSETLPPVTSKSQRPKNILCTRFRFVQKIFRLALPQFLSTRKEKICKNVLTEVSLLCFIQ